MGVGTCTETPNSEGDCQRGHLGSFPASKLGRKVSLESCAERCLRCARCHYVSLSISHDDCSWFHTCRLPLQLTRGGATYRSAAVRTDGAAFEAIASSLAAASAAATAAANQPAAKLLAAMRRRDEREALIVLQSAPALLCPQRAVHCTSCKGRSGQHAPPPSHVRHCATGPFACPLCCHRRPPTLSHGQPVPACGRVSSPAHSTLPSSPPWQLEHVGR